MIYNENISHYAQLKNKRVLIVGGGYVATRKLKNLIGKGAKITVISPKFTERILELHSKNLIAIDKRYLTIDMVEYVKSFFMVIFATDDYELKIDMKSFSPIQTCSLSELIKEMQADL